MKSGPIGVAWRGAEVEIRSFWTAYGAAVALSRRGGPRRASASVEPYQDTAWSNSYPGTDAVADTANAALLDWQALTDHISQIARNEWLLLLHSGRSTKGSRLTKKGRRRWAATDGFHRLNGGRRPNPVIRQGLRTQL